MAQPVWVLSVDLQTKTATFQSGMADAARSARGAFTEIKSGSSEVAGHVSTNMFASRHAVMAVSEAFGDTMPRAITALLVHIGPLGAALEAAFPFAAIALGAVIVMKHLEAMREAGVALTRDQVQFGTEVQNAFNALDMKLTSAQIKTDELRNDHLGALRLQLKLIDEQSMGDLANEFSKLAKRADETFAKLKSEWYELSVGSGGAKNALDEVTTKYEYLLSKGRDKEAGDLLQGTLATAQKVLDAQKQIKAANADTDKMGLAVGTQAKDQEALNVLKAAGVDYDDKAMRSQEALLGALNAQATAAGIIAKLKESNKTNAVLTTGKEESARSAEGAREAAEHSRKMADMQLQIERETAEASLSMKEATIGERLAFDMKLADAEYRVALAGNKALIDALNRGGDDYKNQLRALKDKEIEITEQHSVTLATLNTKATVAQYRLDIQNLEAGEKEKIAATETGSRERLAAIDAAIKAEEAQGLTATANYRDLLKERVEAQKLYDTESAKLAAEAGRSAAETESRSGELALASQREFAQLANSLRRTSLQEQMSQDIAFAEADFTLKKAALDQEVAALDKGAKDYQNRLRSIQNAEKLLTQQHEDDLAAIRAKAQAKDLSDQRSAMASMAHNYASAFEQVLAGHQSFAAMMSKSAETLTTNLISAAIDYAAHLDDDKLDQAKSAARAGFDWGAKYGGPLAPVLAPTMAATFFAGVMAFNSGTDMVPGIGNRDSVPAMLTPGEGVVPGGVMDGLAKMARSGNMGGGTTNYAHVNVTYHVQALDSSGFEKVLDKHADTLQKHFVNEMRRMNL